VGIHQSLNPGDCGSSSIWFTAVVVSQGVVGYKLDSAGYFLDNSKVGQIWNIAVPVCSK